MKRKTFFKALAGLVIAPSTLLALKPKGIYGGSFTGKTCSSFDITPDYVPFGYSKRRGSLAGENISSNSLVVFKKNKIFLANGNGKFVGVSLNNARKGEQVNICTQGFVKVNKLIYVHKVL